MCEQFLSLLTMYSSVWLDEKRRYLAGRNVILVIRKLVVIQINHWALFVEKGMRRMTKKVKKNKDRRLAGAA